MTESMIVKVARAMFEHEWRGQSAPKDEWRQSKAYWIGFARVALEALREYADANPV